MFRRLIWTTCALGAATLPALAHHPLGGEVPGTAVHGLLSGVGHPLIGVDHLAFVIAVGIAASLVGRPVLAPLAFVAATIGGTLLHVAGIGLPFVELAIALSVAAIGVVLLSGASLVARFVLPLFAVAGLFHGHAYGEAVFGAEATPLVAYLVGFGATQWLIAVAAGGLLGRGSPIASGMADGTARLSGAMVAGAGVLLLSDHALTAIGLG